MRGNSLRTPEQVRQVHQRTWALRVDEDGLIEISFDNAHEFDVDAAALVDDDRSRCQQLATDLRNADVPGVVVPSAALPGTQNMVLFGPRVGMSYLFDPISAIDVPATITAHDGRPMISLLDLVRFRDDAHGALEAWQRGDQFEFEEPDWELVRERL